MSKRINPRKKPATQADVDKAYIQGMKDSEVILLSTLLDKHSHEIDIAQAWNDYQKLCLEIAEGRVRIKDLLATLKEESGIDLY